MTDTTPLSPAALAVWDAFNQDEAGVFVDYGDKLAAALRAAADQLCLRWSDELSHPADVLNNIANELEAQ